MRSTFTMLLHSRARRMSSCRQVLASTGLGRVGLLAFGWLAAGALLSGCNGALWGNVVVLGVTIGIFFGTLTLGRSSEGRGGSVSRSTPSGKVG
jgi:hypothetical protein